MFWSIGPSIHCGLFYLKCLWYAPLASCLIPNVGCYCLCSDEGAGPATFLQSPFWLKLVIFLKMFIQMIFSGSQPIKIMAAYSSVPPPLFSGSEMGTVISIDHVIFDWGPSSPLGVQGQFPLFISWWIFCWSIYCTVDRFRVSCEDCIVRAFVYRFLRKCKFWVADNRNMTPIFCVYDIYEPAQKKCVVFAR